MEHYTEDNPGDETPEPTFEQQFAALIRDPWFVLVLVLGAVAMIAAIAGAIGLCGRIADALTD